MNMFFGTIVFIIGITFILTKFRKSSNLESKFEPAIFCSTCKRNVIDQQQPHSKSWVLKYACRNCNETMYITFEHAGFGFECDEDGNLL